MIILGIETSCDETSVAVVKDGTKILSNIVSSSSALQTKYGGVYPEVAAREQVKFMIPVLNEALSGKRKAERIDAVAVTIGPGLIGSLLVGVETAKTIAYALNKPIVPVNHVLAHLYANWLGEKIPQFPALGCIVSGGHTELLLIINHGDFQVLGQTVDDAAGEAFDKTARILGLPYPGGPAIEKNAKTGNPKAYNFPRSMIGSKDYNFSFSGLKTAVLREAKKIRSLNPQLVADLAASVQEAIVDILIKKTLRATEEYQPKSIILAGGVAANTKLKEKMKLKIEKCKLKINLYVPPPNLCTDNAAYIASYAFFNYQPKSWKEIEADPSLTLY